MEESKRILIVDDEADYVNVLSKMFIKLGYEVETALGGEYAIAKILEAPPHLMLLDVRMPGEWGGPETLKWVKKISPDTKVIVVSAVRDPEMIKEAYKLGASGYIPKPFIFEEVKEAVEWILSDSDKESQERHL
ncbi:response regulator [Nitrospinota bacterium]